MTGPAMSVTDLGISFGGLRAVDGVGFDAARNAITTVIGPNGAGKTTLFNLVSGALRPDRGRVELAGKDVTGFSPAALQHAGLARSFQITNLFFDLTVWENAAHRRAGIGAIVARPAAGLGLAPGIGTSECARRTVCSGECRDGTGRGAVAWRTAAA